MQSSLWNAQKSMSVNNSNIIAEKIIVGKIKNQMNLCKYFNKYHKTVGVDAPFDVLLKSLSSVLEKIKKVDTLDSILELRKGLQTWLILCLIMDILYYTLEYGRLY